MVKRVIHNAKPNDGNLVRGVRSIAMQPDISLVPDGFVTLPEELDVLKWALQFYLYQEKNQKLSGKIFLNDITDEKRDIATRLLQRIG